MNLLSGSFGEAYCYYRAYHDTLEISPRALFSSNEAIPVSSIVDIQQLGADASKKFGETAALGGVGLAVGSLLGPVGALAGLAAGAMAGGKNNYVAFSLQFADGRHFVAKASVSEFGELYAAFQAGRTLGESAQIDVVATKKAKRRDTSKAREKLPSPKRLQPLPGRDKAKAPEPTCRLYEALNDKLTKATKHSPCHFALVAAQHYARKLNQTKWSYFNETLIDDDVQQAILIRIVTEEQRAAKCLEQGNACRERAQEYRRELEEARATLASQPPSLPRKWWQIFENENNEGESERVKLEAKTKQQAEWAQNNDAASARADELQKMCHEGAQALANEFAYAISTDDLTAARKRYGTFRLAGDSIHNDWEINKSRALKILQALHPRIGESPPSEQLVAPDNSAKVRLTALTALRDDGLITDEEYSARRNAILDAI